MPKFDVEQYRARRAQAIPLTAIQGDIVDALASKANVQLWADGITVPNFQSNTNAFAHFHGFRNALVERAAMLANTDPTHRFAANDVEAVLDPVAVQHFVNNVSLDLTESELRRLAAVFVADQYDSVPRRNFKM